MAFEFKVVADLSVKIYTIPRKKWLYSVVLSFREMRKEPADF